MIAEYMVQGTEEWKEAKLGIPSSSNFSNLITTKGVQSKQRTKYMYQLAAERITKTSEETYSNKIMERGILMEGEARDMYDLLTGHEVEKVGICYPNEKKLYSCSPDGLVNKDGLVEIKCPTSAVHVGYLLENKLPTEYFQQIQGQLLVTSRKWCDFFSFYPGLKPVLIRVKPEKSFLEALERELGLFVKELDEITEKLK